MITVQFKSSINLLNRGKIDAKAVEQRVKNALQKKLSHKIEINPNYTKHFGLCAGRAKKIESA